MRLAQAGSSAASSIPFYCALEKVMTENSFEIPQTVSDWAEQNVKQANAAYEHLSVYRVGYGPISGSTQTSNP